MNKRQKVAQLRALAASTTFPEEAASARAKADKLEAELPAQPLWDSLLDVTLRDNPDIVIDREAMKARWQRMFDEAMGRKR